MPIKKKKCHPYSTPDPGKRTSKGQSKPQEALLGQRQRKTRHSTAKQQTKSAASDTHLESLPELYLHDLHHNIPVISEPVPISSIAV